MDLIEVSSPQMLELKTQNDLKILKNCIAFHAFPEFRFFTELGTEIGTRQMTESQRKALSSKFLSSENLFSFSIIHCFQSKLFHLRNLTYHVTTIKGGRSQVMLNLINWLCYLT